MTLIFQKNIYYWESYIVFLFPCPSVATRGNSSKRYCRFESNKHCQTFRARLSRSGGHRRFLLTNSQTISSEDPESSLPFSRRMKFSQDCLLFRKTILHDSRDPGQCDYD